MFTNAKKRVIVIEKIDDKLLKENKTIALYKQKQNQHFTMVPWVNAMGQPLNVYYILQMPDTLKMEITIPKHYGTLYINNSGYVVDNHVSNYFEGASALNKKYNVNIMTFPANTTHLLQPLDNVPFSSFSSHLSKLIVKYLSPDEKGKRHNITSEQYPFLCYRAWQESFTANNIMQAWSKVFAQKKTQPPKPSNQLAVINTNQEIVVHTPIITKEAIRAMRKHKTDGCDLTISNTDGKLLATIDEVAFTKSTDNEILKSIITNPKNNNNSIVSCFSLK
ncbi:hypothetical protein ACTFIY_003699 [Dictyostelium cf. discoideum]